MDIIKVAIVDDHIIFRKGLFIILNEINAVKVVGEASNGNEILALAKSQEPDVIFMDIKMPVMDGVEATRKVLEIIPDVKVIALTMHEEIGYFNKMLDAGAQGFLLKKTNKDELEKAIQQVVLGNTYFSEEFIANVNKHSPQPKTSIKISEREKEVLDLICKGFSNTEIAGFLGLSIRTVDGHRARLFEKTGAKNAPNLVLFAIKNGLV